MASKAAKKFAETVHDEVLTLSEEEQRQIELLFDRHVGRLLNYAVDLRVTAFPYVDTLDRTIAHYTPEK